MLFNSFAFMFVYLPITLVGFFVFGQWGRTAALTWLLACSLAFYGYWNLAYLPLLVGSIGMNYGFAMALGRRRSTSRARSLLFALAIAGNLALLGYFKY